MNLKDMHSISMIYRASIKAYLREYSKESKIEGTTNILSLYYWCKLHFTFTNNELCRLGGIIIILAVIVSTIIVLNVSYINS